MAENHWVRDSNGAPLHSSIGVKRIRRSGKYTQQERETIRRERNRMHAKKTRDRKKQFLELSEKIISEMETEAQQLREYMLSMNLMTEEEYVAYRERDIQSKLEIKNHLQFDDMDGCSSDEDIDDEDDDSNDESHDSRGHDHHIIFSGNETHNSNKTSFNNNNNSFSSSKCSTATTTSSHDMSTSTGSSGGSSGGSRTETTSQEESSISDPMNSHYNSVHDKSSSGNNSSDDQ